jgi:hypothetical protein
VLWVNRVAVDQPSLHDKALFSFRVLPANRNKIREPTSGLEPLTCSSYE